MLFLISFSRSSEWSIISKLPAMTSVKMTPAMVRIVFILLRGVDEELGDLVADRKHFASWLHGNPLEFRIETVREKLASLGFEFLLVFLLLCHVRSIVELGLESTPFKCFLIIFQYARSEES